MAELFLLFDSLMLRVVPQYLLKISTMTPKIAKRKNILLSKIFFFKNCNIACKLPISLDVLKICNRVTHKTHHKLVLYKMSLNCCLGNNEKCFYMYSKGTILSNILSICICLYLGLGTHSLRLQDVICSLSLPQSCQSVRRNSVFQREDIEKELWLHLLHMSYLYFFFFFYISKSLPFLRLPNSDHLYYSP